VVSDYRLLLIVSCFGVKDTTAPYLVLWFMNVKDVHNSLEVAQNVIMTAHVGGHDAANNVLAKSAKLLDG